MRNLVLIKLGGSIITDKNNAFTAKGRTMLRLAREIKNSRKKLKNTLIIIGHGTGSYGHVPAAKYKTKEGINGRESIYGMSITEDAARRLNGILINNFLKEKLPVFSFSPASFIFSDRQRYIKSYFEPVFRSLTIGVIPVVYGDVIMDKSIGCTIFSTEKVFSILASKLKSSYNIRIIYASDVDGVYDENGKVIPVISSKNFASFEKEIIGAKGIDVTGGMLHKVNEALQLAKTCKIKTMIINGNKIGRLEKAILGRAVEATIITK